MIEQLIKDLIFDEGLELKPYKCTVGKLTIGIGRNLDDKRLTMKEIDFLKTNGDRKERLKEVSEKELFQSLISDFKEYGITKEEALYLLNNDISDFTVLLNKNLLWFKSEPDDVKRVLINMAFNLGIGGLLTFKNTLKLIEQHKYKEASNQMLLSKWAKQVKGRAKRLSNILKNV